MNKTRENGNAIMVVLVLFVVLGLISAGSFQMVANINNTGQGLAAEYALDNVMNQIKFILNNSNTCNARLRFPPITAANIGSAQKAIIIKDDAGNIFLQDGSEKDNFSFTVEFTAKEFGRQGGPFAPGGRFLGTLSIATAPLSLGKLFSRARKPLELIVFVDGNDNKFCSIKKMFTSYIGPAVYPNRKNSVECLDVGGKPVEVTYYTDPPTNSKTEKYLSCFIPVTKIMPGGCISIGNLLAQDEIGKHPDGKPKYDPGQGWNFDPIAKDFFTGGLYAEASYCL